MVSNGPLPLQTLLKNNYNNRISQNDATGIDSENADPTVVAMQPHKATWVAGGMHLNHLKL